MAGFFSRHNNAILCNVAASAGNYRNASFAVSGFFSRHSKAILCTVGASAGLYFIYRYYIAKKQQIRSRAEALAGIEYRRRRVEKLVELRDKLEQLLGSLDNFEPEPPETEDDECIVCNSAKAIIQTYPCKHRVLCRRCFVKTLQVAVNDLNLPLKCVVCRTRIQTLDRERHDVHLLTPPDTQQQPAQETQC